LLLHPTISITGGFELHPSIFKKKKQKKCTQTFLHQNIKLREVNETRLMDEKFESVMGECVI
jgi:hypothetical protein